MSLPHELRPPIVRLAHSANQGDNNLLGRHGIRKLTRDKWPSLLLSQLYVKPFLEQRADYAVRDWALDSGAYTARSQGIEICIDEYIELCLHLMATDPGLREIFSLDVIGDHKATDRNTRKMWEAGVQAIPAYHLNEPTSYLKHIAKEYPKIAIGGMADLRGTKKFTYVEQCFARVWPKRIHGFGVGSRKMIMSFPWHSVDATNWIVGAVKFGQWQGFGEKKAKLRISGSQQNLQVEIENYLKIERDARSRWAKEMKLLESDGTLAQLSKKKAAYDGP